MEATAPAVAPVVKQHFQPFSFNLLSVRRVFRLTQSCLMARSALLSIPRFQAGGCEWCDGHQGWDLQGARDGRNSRSGRPQVIESWSCGSPESEKKKVKRSRRSYLQRTLLMREGQVVELETELAKARRPL